MKRYLSAILFLFFMPVCDVLPQSEVYPKIDGKIEDDEWAGAKTFEDFTMIVPKTTEKYFDKTIVYLKQSKDAVYVGVKFWPRGRVIRQSLIRDRSTDEENEFFILLDLENKRKNGYFFAFSFLNNQRDLIIYNQRQLSQEWDWIWQNKSVVYREPSNGEAVISNRKFVSLLIRSKIKPEPDRDRCPAFCVQAGRDELFLFYQPQQRINEPKRYIRLGYSTF